MLTHCQDALPLWALLEPSFVASAYVESPCARADVPSTNQIENNCERIELRSHLLIRFPNPEVHSKGIAFDIQELSCDCLPASNQLFSVVMSTRVQRSSVEILIVFQTEPERTEFVRQATLLQSTPSLQEFQPVATIGRGKWGKVIACQKVDRNDEATLYAVKEIRVREKMSFKHIIDERFVLGLVPDHPFLIKMHFAISKGTHLYIVMDFAVGGDLFSAMRKFRISSMAAKFYASQIVLALEHLHALKIIHRDIKPENILLDLSGNLKLADFGLSKHVGKKEWTETVCGTDVYMAPEMLSHQKYSYSVDIWQLGCLIYELYAGCCPFYQESSSRAETRRRILKCQVQYPQKMPLLTQEFLMKILVPSPSERLGCIQGSSWSCIKQDAFFTSIEWETVLSRRVQAPIQTVQNGMDVLDNFDEEFLYESPEFEVNSLQGQVPPTDASLWGFNYCPSFPQPLRLKDDLLPSS